jgi:hypothetical protein
VLSKPDENMMMVEKTIEKVCKWKEQIEAQTATMVVQPNKLERDNTSETMKMHYGKRSWPKKERD